MAGVRAEKVRRDRGAQWWKRGSMAVEHQSNMATGCRGDVTMGCRLI